DFRDQAPYKHAPPRRWVPHGDAKVLYVTPYDMMPWKIASTLGEIHYDLVYINSFFDALFSISPLLAMRGGLLQRTPVIIAPRGEFAASALDLKGMKKRSFVLISRFLRLHESVVWHATSAGECTDIRRVLGTHFCPPVLAANLPGSYYAHGSFESPGRTGPLRVVFLARISRMK